MAAIDVLLPVRNGMPFLHQAIESIRRQTVFDWRLLILDHGSSDGSLELAQCHAQTDKRILSFSHPEAESLAALRNIGLAKCDCRYLMLQDADDVSFPNRMEITTRVFDFNPRLLAVGGEAVVIDPKGARTGYLRVPCDPKAIAAASFFYFPMLHPTITADFRALDRLGLGYGKDAMDIVPARETLAISNLAEDYILFGQLAVLGPCANVAAPLVRYRRHATSVGIANPVAQIGQALRISRFLAGSFCRMNGLYAFDPGPFCNHADYVFDFHREDYSAEFSHMAQVLRRGLGESPELERELAFRWILATRRSAEMALRFARFQARNLTWATERRTVRNWLLRNVRRGKYVYRSADAWAGNARAAV